MTINPFWKTFPYLFFFVVNHHLEQNPKGRKYQTLKQIINLTE